MKPNASTSDVGPAKSYVYDDAFQNMAATGSVYAATRIIRSVRTVVPVESVLDVGCARGTWLREWRNQSVTDIVGIDGDYVSRESLQIDPACFKVHDLRRSFDLGRRFDLVQCLEVAEHLPPSRAPSLIADLVAHAPVVLFSAASPGQGGENHINEQPAHYWQRLFAAHDFVPIDCLRPLLQREKAIPSWYRFNLLFYVHRGKVAEVAPFARQFEVMSGVDVPDVSPWHYRLRKGLVLALPKALCDRVAHWNARRF